MDNETIEIIAPVAEVVTIEVQDDAGSIAIVVDNATEIISLEVSDVVQGTSVPTEIYERLQELEEDLDGQINGMDFLTHYRLTRDN